MQGTGIISCVASSGGSSLTLIVVGNVNGREEELLHAGVVMEDVYDRQGGEDTPADDDKVNSEPP